MTTVVNDDRLEVVVIETLKLETPTGATGPQGDKGDTGDTGPKGDKGDKGDTGSQGESGTKYQRTTVQIITPSLLVGGRHVTTVPINFSYEVYSIQTDKAARVRLYDTLINQTNDVLRQRGVDPVVGTNHGVMLDFALSTLGTFTMSPVVTCVTFTGSIDVPITIDNIGSTASVITIIITYLRKE